MNKSIRPRKETFVVYLLPTFIIYASSFLIPVVMAFYFSLQKFKNINNMSFVGIRYYSQLFRDENLWLALKNNFFLVFVCLIGQIGIAFILANMLSSRLINKRVGSVLRTVIYFPVTLSAVVIGYVWTMIYDYNYGLLNFILKAIGYPDLAIPWLSESKVVMVCVSVPMIWQYVGFHLIILLSAMTAINPEIFEMAELDGATGIRKALYITFPLIKNTLMVCVFLCISANMKAFDHIMAMTKGGPGYSSLVVSYYAYKIAFDEFNIGYANAVSVAIMVVTSAIFVVTKFIMNLIGRKSVLE